MAKVYLEGGPCNGRIVNLTPAEADTGELACRGHVYKNPYTGQHHGRYLVFIDSGPLVTGGGGGTTAGTPRAHKGWADIRRSMNHRWPAALHASDKHIRAALRSVSHARKVRL